MINVIIGCKNLFRTKKSGPVFALTNELTRTEHDHKIEWLSTRSIVVSKYSRCLVRNTVQKQPKHRQNSTYLVFYDIRETSLLFRTAGVILIEGTSVVLKWQAVKWSMNFVLRAMTLRYPPIQSRMRYRASQHFMTSLKGKSEHYGSPGDHIKVFVIQYRKGRGFFLPFFFKWKYIILYYRGGSGAKIPIIQAEWF